MVTIRPQGRSSLPNSKEIYCLLGKTVTMLSFSLISREAHVTLESMVSMEKIIPLGCLHRKSFQWYLETLLISSVSGYPIPFLGSLVQGSSLLVDQYFNFEGELSTPLEGAQSLSFHRSFPKGWGALLKHPQPLVCGIRKSQDSS